MTQVGTYTIVKGDSGYALVTKDQQILAVYPTARAAMDKGVALTAEAYKASKRV